MEANDPRHGTYAGYQQHLRDGDKPSIVCPPCHQALLAYQRVRPHLHAIGKPPRVPLGQVAFDKLATLEAAGLTDSQMKRATGSAASCVRRYLRDGPTARVLRRVRQRLETIDTNTAIATQLTHVGTIRRAQALGRIGYSAAKLAPTANMHPDAIALLQRGDATQSSDTTRRKIANAYQQLHMRPLDPTHDRFVSRTINRAARDGWQPPMAWDHIDDPDEQPAGGIDTRTDRAQTLADIAKWGGNIDEATRRLGVSRDSLQKWAERHGHSDLYRTLAGRQARRNNQHNRVIA